MSDLLLELIPIAVGVALSPFPVVPVVLLLLTARPLANGGGFLAGWFAGLLAMTAVFAVVAGAIELWDEVPTWASWVRLGLGALLVVVGIRTWLGRGGSGGAPSWMAALDDYTPVRAVRLGVLLAVANPKSLLLVLAGGVAIGSAELGTGRSAAAALLFAAVAASSVALPVLLRLVRGDRVAGPLEAARRWLVAHYDAIVAGVVIVIGVLVAAKGWSSL